MNRDASDRMLSAGRRAFIALVFADGLHAVARGVGMKKTWACDLAGGRRLPSLKAAVLIEEKYGIPPRAWLS